MGDLASLAAFSHRGAFCAEVLVGPNLYTPIWNSPLAYYDSDGRLAGILVIWLPIILEATKDVIFVGSAVIAGVVTAKTISKDCDQEWADARRMCAEELAKPHPSRPLTGGYKDIENCARGLVSEACGGNPVSHIWDPGYL